MAQIDYSKYGEQAIPGGFVKATSNKVKTGYTRDAQKKIVDFTPGSPSANEVYTWILNGQTLSVQAAASGETVATLIDKIVAAIQADYVAYGAAVPTDNTSSMRLTGRHDAVDFQIVAVTSNITIASVQAASDNSQAVYGEVAIPGTDFNTFKPLSGLEAREIDLTPAAVNSTVYMASVEVYGQRYDAQITSSGSATAAAIVNALVAVLNGLLPANTVLAANDSDNLRLTAEIPGLGFSYSVGSSDATATWTVAADNKATAVTDVQAEMLGIVGDSKRYAQQDAGLRGGPVGTVGAPMVAPAGATVNLVADAEVAIELVAQADVLPGSDVYLGVQGDYVNKWAASVPSGEEANFVKMPEIKWSTPSIRGVAFIVVDQA